MNRNMKLLPKRMTFVQRSTVTFIRNVKTMLTIEDMPHPKSLPIVGTKLDLLAAGSGKKYAYENTTLTYLVRPLFVLQKIKVEIDGRYFR